MILRYAHLYGREKRLHGLVGGLLDRIGRGLPPRIFGGEQSNDFTYIADVVEANLRALKAPSGAWGEVYNVGTGQELTTTEAAQTVFDVFGYQGDVETVPQRSVDPDRFVYDCSKATRLLGFTAAYSFRRGLEEMRDAGG
jgi:nucleoside-diphosphate-sugar epimerase